MSRRASDGPALFSKGKNGPGKPEQPQPPSPPQVQQEIIVGSNVKWTKGNKDFKGEVVKIGPKTYKICCKLNTHKNYILVVVDVVEDCIIHNVPLHTMSTIKKYIYTTHSTQKN